MVHASAVGAIDFTACDFTTRWWTGARLKLRAVEQQLRLRVLELAANRAAHVQTMTDLGRDPKWRQEFAIEAVERFQDEAMPWFARPSKQNEVSEDEALDRIALWYRIFGHDGVKTDG